jgi:hypothetical protein
LTEQRLMQLNQTLIVPVWRGVRLGSAMHIG